MERYLVSKAETKEEDAISLFKERVKNNPKFQSTYDEDLLAVQEGYVVYPFIDGTIKNLDYLVVMDNKQVSGLIDSKCSYADKNFLMRKLSTRDFLEKEINLSELNIINREELDLAQSQFIGQLMDKTTNSICERHRFILTQKKNVLDIAPIRHFDELHKRYYLEKVYLLKYFQKDEKKTYTSLYSSIHHDFYEFDFLKSNEFKEFKRLHKRPIVPIPKEFVHYYEDLAFDVYKKTSEELKYITQGELFHKIKKNIKYEDYSKHRDYLLQLIFFFKKKNYLSQLVYPTKNLEQEIFFDYLTLKHQPDSGYKLAKYVKDGFITDDYAKLLKISADLQNSFARKELYLYYSSAQFYNEYQMKRYSS